MNNKTIKLMEQLVHDIEGDQPPPLDNYRCDVSTLPNGKSCVTLYGPEGHESNALTWYQAQRIEPAFPAAWRYVVVDEIFEMVEQCQKVVSYLDDTSYSRIFVLGLDAIIDAIGADIPNDTRLYLLGCDCDHRAGDASEAGDYVGRQIGLAIANILEAMRNRADKPNRMSHAKYLIKDALSIAKST